MAAQDGSRIVLTTRSFGGRCCIWCGRSTVGPWASVSVRRWMLAEGLWSRERKRRVHRRRRERKEHFGEMVQMDGSFHAWLEERGPEGCLIDLVDDATSKRRSGRWPM